METSQEKTVQKMQEVLRQYSENSSPQEQNQWAQSIKQYSDVLTRSYQRNQQKTAFQVETTVSGSQDLQRLAELAERTPGVKEITFRREFDGTPKIRISTTHEALPKIRALLSAIGDVALSSGSYQQGV